VKLLRCKHYVEPSPKTLGAPPPMCSPFVFDVLHPPRVARPFRQTVTELSSQMQRRLGFLLRRAKPSAPRLVRHVTQAKWPKGSPRIVHSFHELRKPF
jgi:hypothetical protein